ncbi:MAG: putative lipoprotein [Leptospira sp.]|nr:putative lipoprotein [Leptospira sp.]
MSNRFVLFTILCTVVSFSNCSFLDSASGSISRLGFSVSDSTSALVKSISNSASSLSDSSAKKKEEATQHYKEDVMASVALQIQFPNRTKELENEIAMIANEHGLVSWRSNPATYIAIGQGLKEAKVTKSELALLAEKLGSSKREFYNLIEEGYNL